MAYAGGPAYTGAAPPARGLDTQPTPHRGCARTLAPATTQRNRSIPITLETVSTPDALDKLPDRTVITHNGVPYVLAPRDSDRPRGWSLGGIHRYTSASISASGPSTVVWRPDRDTHADTHRAGAITRSGSAGCPRP